MRKKGFAQILSLLLILLLLLGATPPAQLPAYAVEKPAEEELTAEEPFQNELTPDEATSENENSDLLSPSGSELPESTENSSLLITTQGTGEFEGKGDENNPYKIQSAQDLKKLADLVNNSNTRYEYYNKWYILTTDIDLSDYSDGEGWTPIGINSSNPFSGHFIGDGYKIEGLRIYRPDSDNIGLFGYIKDGHVENVNLIDAQITGRNNVGALAGYLSTGTLQDCSSSGSVNGTEQVGGLVGYVYNNSTVQQCISSVDVRGHNDVGGVAGATYYFSSILNCQSTGSVNGTGARVGGVLGSINVNCTMQNCYSTGSVNSTGEDIGGVVGLVGNSSNVQNCYSTGSVDGTNSNIGGVAGGC